MEQFGSYSRDDVIFLLKDISQFVNEESNEVREKLIQSGVHYSEMLPKEYKPTDEYIELFHYGLNKFARKLAIAVGVLSEVLYESKGKNMVLVSLARAGTPAGILIKRYIKHKYNLDIKHYSISIIRGKGIDENAIKYILDNHSEEDIQFIDGWTGKGAITNELSEACKAFNNKYNTNIDDSLGVIADPGYCAPYFGTREDFFIPSACLNSTVSGLVSRTFLRGDIIGEKDFHGAKYYKELTDDDLSHHFIDSVVGFYGEIDGEVDEIVADKNKNPEISFMGLRDVKEIQEKLGIDNIHFVKPGIGETTRVLLRRVPWKILLREDARDVDHIIQLAKERGVEVERHNLNAYQCCGIIKPMGAKEI